MVVFLYTACYTSGLVCSHSIAGHPRTTDLYFDKLAPSCKLIFAETIYTLAALVTSKVSFARLDRDKISAQMLAEVKVDLEATEKIKLCN